ncbi:hypothetical protein [Streptomyces sp. NPDC021096]|uniref:hypothetical protein n=1 Tax=Streptomyces sp. NPDC021096 TaxID=3154792 RepID=UPI0033D03CAB
MRRIVTMRDPLRPGMRRIVRTAMRVGHGAHQARTRTAPAGAHRAPHYTTVMSTEPPPT